MATYKVYGIVTGSKYIGTVEAENEDEAKDKGGELETCHVSICHHCACEIDDPQITEIQVEKA